MTLKKSEVSLNLETCASLSTNKIISKNQETGELELDCDALLEYDQKLYEELLNNPEEIIGIIKRYIEDCLFLEKKASFSFKIINFHNKINISAIRRENLGGLYVLQGLIKRITKVIPRTKMVMYECLSCGTSINVLQTSKRIDSPHRCSCGNKHSFRKIHQTRENIQEMNLEEQPDEIEGRQPQLIRCYLEGCLTDPSFSEKLQPGKRIEIIGIIKELPPFMTKKDTEENISDFMVYVTNTNSLEDEDELITTEEDIKTFREIASNNPLKLLSENLAESIYGYNNIKEAVVLQLAKGVKKQRPDGTFTRGDIHILLTGDAGVAKSLLLKASSLRSPRSRYVSGTRSSGVGLTVSLLKDELTGAWCLDSGALVLANRGVVFLDELDKMNKEQLASLYEPLESQCYDEKTEILTEKGWKLFKDIKDEKVASLNQRGEFEFVSPIQYIKKEYSGDMYFISSRQVNLAVTPNHKMYVSIHRGAGRYEEFKLIQMKDIPITKHIKFKKNAKWIGQKQDYFKIKSVTKFLNQNHKGEIVPEISVKMNDWLEFLGYYLSEGSCQSKKGVPYRITLSQNKGRIFNQMISCLERLNFKYFIYKNNITINSKQIAMYLSQFGKCHDKFIPEFVKLLPPEQIKIFLKAYISGDGHRHKKTGTISIVSSSKKIADDITELAVKIGTSANTYILRKGGTFTQVPNNRMSYIPSDIYNIVLMSDARNEPHINHSGRRQIKKKFYSGKIFCIEVPNHIIYVRRKGKPVWCGNTISIAKANISATLRAETSVLAAANPIRGRFDLTQPLSNQIDLPLPLLNRFDLVFVILDKPNEEYDKEAVKHLFSIHQQNKTSDKDIQITPKIFKKYISYVRKLTPKIKDDILPILQEIYLKIRKKAVGENGSMKGLPINLRNVEGLLRLSESSAKIRMSEFVEIEDLEIAEKIFLFSLKQVGLDPETGIFDMSRISERVPVSKRGKMESVLDILEELSQRFGKEVPFEEIEKKAGEIGIRRWELSNFLDQLKRENQIIEPRRGIYQIWK